MKPKNIVLLNNYMFLNIKDGGQENNGYLHIGQIKIGNQFCQQENNRLKIGNGKSIGKLISIRIKMKMDFNTRMI